MRPHSKEGSNQTLSKCSWILDILNLKKYIWTSGVIKSSKPCHFFFTILSQISGIRGPLLYNLHEYFTNPEDKSNYTCHFSNFISSHNLNLEVPSTPNPMDFPSDVLELSLASSRGLTFQEFRRQLVNTAVIQN